MPPNIQSVVLGGGPSGVRAAVALGATLLEAEGQAGGVVHPSLGEDRGVSSVDRAQSVDEGYGSAPRVSLRQALLVKGKVVDLPLKRRQLPKMLQSGSAAALRDWAQTRGRRAAQSLLGGGHEERSYRDWVVHRHGEAAFRLLFSSWAARRFGAPEQASVSLAHLHHALPATDLVGLGRSPEAGWTSLVEGLADLRTWVGIEGIECDEGRAARVRTDEWTLDLEGPLFCAAPLPELAEWLGDELDPVLQREMRSLRCRHRLQVGLHCTTSLPDEVHVLDDAPFFRISRVEPLGGEPGLLVAHISCDDDHPLWASGEDRVAEEVVASFAALGLGRAEAAGVQRLPDHDPCWRVDPWHPKHVRVAQAMAERSIFLVGRSAGFRWMDPGQELQYVSALKADPSSWHELQRTLLDPPVLPDEEHLSITRFLER